MGYVESTNTWREQTNKITTWILLNHQKHHFKSNRNFQRRKSRWTPKDPDNEHLELFKEREGKTATCKLNHFKCPWFAGAMSIKTQVSPLYSTQGSLLQAHISYRWNFALHAPLVCESRQSFNTRNSQSIHMMTEHNGVLPLLSFFIKCHIFTT